VPALRALASGRMTWLRKIVSTLDITGHVAQQPPVWAGIAAALEVGGGERGRRAATRGSICYWAAVVVANVLIKPLVRRPRPAEAGEGRPGPVTSSFPSGHAASDLAFTFGVAQELPVLFVPLAVATAVGHWSLVRSRGHHASDVLVGGAIGVGVALAASQLWRRAGTPSAPERTGPADGSASP
jgi:membrane-associated phospholipid phosphatase